MITIDRARFIASEWHSGQWSALYAFSSSGTVTSGIEREITDDIEECKNAEERRKLENLLEYVLAKLS